MQVVWEANTADFARRKRAARACSICQKRKKRCHHTFVRNSTGENEVRDDYAHTESDRELPNLTHKEPVRFVGDLNPESILTDLSTRPKGFARENPLGSWVQPPQDQGADQVIQPNGTNIESPGRTSLPTERYAKVERGRRTLTGHQKHYLQAVGAFRVLPRATQDVLITCFISTLDSLLPLLNGGRLLRDYTAGNASIFLVQAVCLVTCKNEEAAAYLRLTEDGPVMDPIPFARALHTGLDAAMKADLEADRLTKVQILTLMSLHNDGPGGLEESSMHLAQAIHDAHTAGLHIHTSGRRTNDEAAYTWWCLWVLDKFNACLGGRPIMIADRDIGIARPEVEADILNRSHSLALWLALGDLLARVISFYRPIADQSSTGWEVDFPAWKDIKFGFEIPLASHRNLLELCYQVIAILTCRSGGPSTASYARRIEAADRIQQLMSSCTKNTSRPTPKSVNTDHAPPPLPLVPYAVSLSLTVTYRLLRDNLSHIKTSRAKKDLAIRCDILESLSSRWWSADAMAKLGRKALRSLEMSGDTAGGSEKEQDVVEDLLDAEVNVCRYRKYHDKSKTGIGERSEQTDEGTTGLRTPLSVNVHHDRIQASNMTAGMDSVGSGLDVLSTAAAAQADPNFDSSTIGGYPHLDSTMPSIGVPGTKFHDLDMLFGDFFDLSMPTFFEDPLFEGDAFGSSWPGVEGGFGNELVAGEYPDLS